MLLTITTTHPPATDLGYLLHKNPSRVQQFEMPFGRVHIFYPEISAARCTAALLLDVNPVGLVRKEGAGGFPLAQYVNDRPYAASSFLSTAIAQVYGSALNGTSKERPELAAQPIPLSATVTAVPVRGGGETLLRSLFEPLGYAVTVESAPLDAQFPEWGESRHVTLTLEATTRLQDLLAHLYVLIPVLDDQKHYYVGNDEIDKLLRVGEGWLATHPERTLITNRYLRHQRTLTRAALARLTDGDSEDPDAEQVRHDAEEAIVEKGIGLHEQRLGAVLAAIRQSGARRVLDLGCGEGRLLRMLLKEPQFETIVGMDVVYRALEIAADKLRISEMPPMQRARITLLHGSLMYRDARLAGYDAAAVVEVIEHLDPPRLTAFERVLFEFARPGLIALTTPNSEYNVKWETLPAGKFRHKDHRFEWTRAEFEAWAAGMCARFNYTVRFLPIGEFDPAVGAPSQMAIFEVNRS